METTVTTSRGEFAALSEGPGRGPVVIVQHGFPDVPHTFVPVMKLLAAAGCRVVAPYLRGYAPGPPEGPWTLESLAEDACALAEALGMGTPVTYVGHDWGAIAGYLAAARMPGRFAGLVTVSVPHPLAFARSLGREPAQLWRSRYMVELQPRGVGEWLLARDDFAMVDRLWARWSPGLARPEEHLGRVKACLRASGGAPLGYYRSIGRPVGRAVSRLFDRELRRIRVPTRHLTGGDDGCVGPRVGLGQERYFCGPFASEIIAGVGHFLPLERPTLLVERTLDLMAATGALPAEARPTRPGAAGPGRGSA